MIEIPCPDCGKILRVGEEYRGSRGRCIGCGHYVDVPSPVFAEFQPDQQSIHLFNVPGEILVDISNARKNLYTARRSASYVQKAGITGILLLTLITIIVALIGPESFQADLTAGTPSQLLRAASDTAQITAVSQSPARTIELSSTQLVYLDMVNFHPARDCVALKAIERTAELSLALSLGRQPCVVCAPGQPVNPIPLQREVSNEKQRARVSASDKSISDSNVNIVFTGQIGEKYHRRACSYLKGIVTEMDLSKALTRGLTACADCRPPK